MSACRAGLFELSCVVENALSTEGVKALLESHWVLKHIRADGA